MAIQGSWSQQLTTSKQPTELLGTVNQVVTIQDLTADTPTTTTIDVHWTVVVGTTSEELRWSTSPITVGNFGSANLAVPQPPAAPPGSSQDVTVTGLPSGTLIYFAVQSDTGLSNIATETTQAIVPINDLAADNPTATTVDLEWTVANPTTSEEVRWSTSPITVGNFASATLAVPQPVLMSPGSTQNLTVTGLPIATLIYFAVNSDNGLSNVVSETTLDPFTNPIIQLLGIPGPGNI